MALVWFSLAALAVLAAVYYRQPSSTLPLYRPDTKMGQEKSIQMDTIVLFGDSITQQSWGLGGLGAFMANVYQRKRDIMNRGLSGYNTAWAIPIAKQWLPRVGESRPTTSLMLIWFGANDAALPPSPQALTIEEFKANLHAILALVRDPHSPHYSPNTKFLLLTPPPVDAATRNNDLVTRNPPRVPDRDYERTRLFAVAVQEVATEASVPSVDCWGSIVEAAARDGGLDKYLHDGLHLSPDGYAVVIGKVAEAITVHLPELHWDKLEQTYPHWADIVNNGALGSQYLEKK